MRKELKGKIKVVDEGVDVTPIKDNIVMCVPKKRYIFPRLDGGTGEVTVGGAPYVEEIKMKIGTKYEYIGSIYELVDDNRAYDCVYLQSVNDDTFVRYTRARFLELVASGRMVEKSED